MCIPLVRATDGVSVNVSWFDTVASGDENLWLSSPELLEAPSLEQTVEALLSHEPVSDTRAPTFSLSIDAAHTTRRRRQRRDMWGAAVWCAWARAGYNKTVHEVALAARSLLGQTGGIHGDARCRASRAANLGCRHGRWHLILCQRL